jgi:hypothetical protein
MQDQSFRRKLSRKDYTDFEFIYGEVKKLLGLSPSELMKYYDEHPEDTPYFLSRPDGFLLMFTLAGERRFQQVLQRGLRSLAERSTKYDPEAVLHNLKDEVVARLLNGPEVSDENAHAVFDSVIDTLTKAQVSVTHYVPCSLVAHRKTTRFTIGPVTFTERKLFLDEHRAALLNRGIERPDPLLEQLERFFSMFSWIGRVTIPPCDPNISKARANETVQRALDLFKLFIGSPRASLVRRAYDVGAPSKMVFLTSTAEDTYALSYDGGKLTDAVVNEDWYDQIKSFPQWSIAQAVLSWASQFESRLPEVQQRFLDGLAWHSDAISEGDLASRIVKFWTGIERVVTLKHGDEVQRRAAIMNSDSKADFEEKYKAAKRLYSKRSQIVHGTANRAEDWLGDVALQSEVFSQRILYNYLFLIDRLNLGSTSTDKESRLKLTTWFERADAMSKHN